ncbi:OmpA family protein [Maribacter sp. 2307UL18-2]|uniref:OmpA family protein n=1 Tax=Maribacter sp. 2307UL18-2 TaxID=3386274 RepID=UPI0039BCC5A9
MKNNILFILFTCCAMGFAQKKNLSADKNFESLWYKKAAQQYEEIISKGDHSQEVLQKAGDAYFFNTDMKNAHRWYAELFANYENVIAPTYFFRYIHSLKGIGNYTLAKALMKIHGNKLNADGYDVAQLGVNDEGLDMLLNKQPQFLVTNLSINTKMADFGTAYYKDKIVFASNRDSLNLKSRLYKWNNQPWLNLFVADTTQKGTDMKNIAPFSKNINTKYHEAMAAFGNNGNRIYFTRNNYTDKKVRTDEEGFNHLKLYYADFVNDKWTTANEVPFNSEDYSVGQPALSADGKKLYFVSDMPGGIGDTDIFVVDVLEGDKFSTPKNLGDVINTSGREMFPFLTKNKLYFSSDGHLGLGGLDVFESEIEPEFSEPVNLAKPLNSNKDDFAYIVNEDTRRGYVSSNREGGVGDDDIYSFERLEEKCGQTVKGTVLRKSNDQSISNVSVQLFDEKGTLLVETETDAFGAFDFANTLDCATAHQIKISKEGYVSDQKDFMTTDVLDSVNNLQLFMAKELNKLIVNENGVLKIKIDNIYFDLNKAEIRPDAAQELNKIVEVMKEYPKMTIKIEAHTDARGRDSYNKYLSDKRAKSTAKYITTQGIESGRIESAIGYGEDRVLNRCKNRVKCTNAEHDVNRRSEFIIVSLD